MGVRVGRGVEVGDGVGLGGSGVGVAVGRSVGVALGNAVTVAGSTVAVGSGSDDLHAIAATSSPESAQTANATQTFAPVLL